MVIFIQDAYENIANTGGSVERASLWNYLEENIPGAERLVLKPKTTSLAGYIKNTCIQLVRIARSKNRIYLLTYPSYFPFGPIYLSKNLLVGTIFLAFLKLINLVNRGVLIVKFHDIPFDPRFAPQTFPGPEAIPAHLALTMKICERLIFRMASEIWVTSAAFTDYLVNERSVNPIKIKVVINGSERHQDIPPALVKDSRVRFLYAGNLSRDWGVDEVVATFGEAPPGTELILCGANGDWLKGESAINPRIRYLGWLSARETIGVAKGCDIGIIPYRPDRVSDQVFPTKLALYITCGLATLATGGTESARIVTEARVGLAYEIGRLAEYIVRLTKDEELRINYQRNCQRIAEEYYWDSIFGKAFQGIIPTTGLQLTRPEGKRR